MDYIKSENGLPAAEACYHHCFLHRLKVPVVNREVEKKLIGKTKKFVPHKRLVHLFLLCL